MNQTSRLHGGHFCEPEWFHEKADNENEEETLEVLKAKADHAYACHNFDNAADLYGLILQKQISMPIFREACEGRVRCLIKKPAQDQTDALNLAMQLLGKTNPANVEYAMNSYLLLAEVFTASNSHKLAAGCWIAAIAFHPQYPQLWQKLANTYQAMFQEDMQKLCQMRAKNLTASFEKNLPESFAKNAYNNISAQEEDDGFNDLGSSKNRLQKEAEVERRSKLMCGKAHPPPWLSNDQELEEYLHNFMLSCKQTTDTGESLPVQK